LEQERSQSENVSPATSATQYSAKDRLGKSDPETRK